MIECIVFDFDGVLVDSNAVKRQAYFDIFAPLGATCPTVERVLNTITDGDRYQVIARILHELITAGDIAATDQLADSLGEYAARYNRLCEEHAATCREIPGASTSLSRLARRYGLYINSATPEEPLRRIVQRRGWAACFREVLGRPGTKTENLRHILARERIRGAETVFVGDNQRDLDAALRCGCRFVGIRNAYNDFGERGILMLDDLHRIEEAIAPWER